MPRAGLTPDTVVDAAAARSLATMSARRFGSGLLGRASAAVRMVSFRSFAPDCSSNVFA